MSGDRFEAAADDLRQLPGVIECVVWSDSVSVRYSGRIRELRHRARDYDLLPVNIDGVLYADPLPSADPADSSRDTTDPDPPGVVAEAPSVQSVYLIEGDERQRLLVTTTGVDDAISFLELEGPYGWIVTEAKEAQIRLAPPKSGASFLLSRSTSQLRRIEGRASE